MARTGLGAVQVVDQEVLLAQIVLGRPALPYRAAKLMAELVMQAASAYPDHDSQALNHLRGLIRRAAKAKATREDATPLLNVIRSFGLTNHNPNPCPSCGAKNGSGCGHGLGGNGGAPKPPTRNFFSRALLSFAGILVLLGGERLRGAAA
jgi:hypothetical protein